MPVVEVSAEVFASLLRDADKARAERAERWPAVEDALRDLHSLHERLKELGWRDPMYAPTENGSEFEVIEFGSTGIFRCEIVAGYWFAHDGGDLWPAKHSLMWRPIVSVSE